MRITFLEVPYGSGLMPTAFSASRVASQSNITQYMVDMVWPQRILLCDALQAPMTSALHPFQAGALLA